MNQDEVDYLHERVLKVAQEHDSTWNVMTRENIQKMIEDNGGNYSECLAEAEGKCEVSVGQILQSDLHLVGDVSFLAEAYVLSLKLYDVKQSKLIGIESMRDRSKERLLQGSSNLARKVFGETDGQSEADDVPAAPIPPGGFRITGAPMARTDSKDKVGEIFVNTDVPGANVFIDGSIYPGTTPMTLKNVPAGKHLVAVSKDDQVGFETVDLASDELHKVNITMYLARGSLRINSTPPNAVATLDGRVIGSTPLKFKDTPAGRHVLTLNAPGCLIRTDSIRIPANRIANIDVNLVTGAELVLSVPVGDPSPAVRIRGSHLDTLAPSGTPSLLLEGGRYVAAIEDRRFEPWSDSFDLAAGERRVARIPLQWHIGHASLASTPVAEIRRDGKMLGNTPAELRDLDPGITSFLLRATDFADTLVPVTISSGQTTRVIVNMRRSQAWMDSVSNQTHARTMHTWRVVLLPSAIAVLAGAAYFHVDALIENGNAQDASDAYDNATSDFERHKTEQNDAARAANSSTTVAFILDGVGGALLSAFALTYAF